MLPLVLLGQNATAAAAAVPVNAPPPPDAPAAAAIHRRGLVFGFTLGADFGSASGYPNQWDKIGDPRWYSASGFLTGGASRFFVMGALTDYLSFGFWFGSETTKNDDWRSVSGGGGLKVEVFPLVDFVPPLSGLGTTLLVGIGSGNLTSSHPGVPESSGTQSFVGAGVFHEWSFGHFAGGHFAAGPSAEYDAVFSRPFEAHGFVASARLTFYGGP